MILILFINIDITICMCIQFIYYNYTIIYVKYIFELKVSRVHLST